MASFVLIRKGAFFSVVLLYLLHFVLGQSELVLHSRIHALSMSCLTCIVEIMSTVGRFSYIGTTDGQRAATYKYRLHPVTGTFV